MENNKKQLIIALILLIVFSIIFIVIFNMNSSQEIEAKTTITLNSNDILEDATYDEVIISNDVLDGTVTIRDSKITDLIIYGGGDEAINIEDSIIENVITEKEDGEPIRILVRGNSAINFIEVNSNTIIEGDTDDLLIERVESKNRRNVNLEIRRIEVNEIDVEEDVVLSIDERSSIRNAEAKRKVEEARIRVKLMNQDGTRNRVIFVSRGTTLNENELRLRSIDFEGWDSNGRAFDFNERVQDDLVLTPRFRRQQPQTRETEVPPTREPETNTREPETPQRETTTREDTNLTR